MSSRKELLAAVLDRLELWFLCREETPGELQDQSFVSYLAKMFPACRYGMDRTGNFTCERCIKLAETAP